MSRRHQVPAWALPAALVAVLVIVIALVVSSCSGGSSAKKSDVKAGGNAVTLDGHGSSSSASPAATFDYASLVGERLSNAYALMERAGLDPRGGDPDVSVITSDGKRVVNESNWTVTEASYVAKTNTVSLSVDHEGSDLGFDLGSIGGSIADSVGDALGIGGSGSSSGAEGSGESSSGDGTDDGGSADGSGISDLLGSATDQLGEAATQLGEGAGNLVDSLSGLANRFLN